MAGTTTTTTLGLVITAKDEAKQVFEDFATNLKEQMTSIQESLTQAFNMEGAITQVNDGVTQITEALGRVRTAEGEMTTSEAVTAIGEQMGEITSAVNKMSESVTKGFASVTEQAGKMASSMHSAAKGINFGEMMNAGMIMETTGKQMLGFFGEAVKAGADFDQSIKNATSSLNANLGKQKLSTEQIQNMSRAALQLGSDGFFSANQVSEALNTMAKQGLTYQQIMGGGLQIVHDVAAANQQDLEATANVVSDIYNEMQGQFNSAGLSAQQAAQMIGNSMTVALHHARLNMDDFLGSMKYVGPQASAMGMSIKDVSAAIAVLGEHGIKGTQAGTTLRRMLTNLTPSTKAAATAMQDLGFITKNGQNVFYTSTGQLKSFADIQGILRSKLAGLSPEMQQFYLKTMFGQYALSGMTSIVNTSSGKISELTTAMANDNEMTDIMNTKKQGLGMQLQALNAHWQTMQKEIGIMLAPLLEKLIGILTRMMDAWNNLSPSVQKTIVTIGAISAVVLTVGGAVMTFVGTFGMLMNSCKVVAASLEEVGLGFADIVPEIGIIVGIIAALSYAWKNDIGGIREVTSRFTDWFEGIFNKTFAKAKSDVSKGLAELTKGFGGWNRSVMGPLNRAFGAIWTGLSDAMKKAIQVVANGITAVTGWFAKMAPDFNKALKNIIAFLVWLSPLWNAIWTALKIAIGLVFDWIVGTIQHFWGVFSGIIQLITHIINGDWKAAFADLWQIIKNAFLLALDLFGGAEEKMFGFFAKIIERTGIFGKIFGAIFGGAFKAAEKLCQVSSKFIEGIISGSLKVLESLFKGLRDLVVLVFNTIKNAVEKDSSGMMTFLKNVWKTGLDFVKQLWRDVVDVITKLLNVFKETFQTEIAAVQLILKGFELIVKDIFSAIKDLVTGHTSQAMDFFKKAFSVGIDTVKGVVNGLFTLIDGLFGGLPSKMLQWGKNAISMFASGVESGIARIESAVSSVANKVKDFLGFHSPTKAGPLSDSDVYFPNMMKMFTDGVNKNKDKLIQATMGVAVGVQQTFKGTQENVQKIVNTGSSGTSTAVRPSALGQNRQMVVNINIDGRSKQTDKQLAEEIGKQFRTQISMVMG